MKRWGIFGVIMIFLLLICLPSCGCSDDESGDGQPADGAAAGSPQVTVSGNGTVAALNDRGLAFYVSGKIDRIYVEEGDTVNRGDTLAKLDSTDLELALAVAEAGLSQSQAARAQAAAAWEQAAYDLDLYRRVFHASVERMKVMESQLEAAEKTLEAAGQQIEVAEQALAEARKQLYEATLIAPFDGEIAAIYADEGDNAVTGTVILRLVDPASLQLIARINELDVAGVKAGQKVVISVDALPGTVIEGSVVFISPVPRESGAILFEDEDEEKEYEVKIDFGIVQNTPVRVGMNAIAEIIIE